MREKSPMPQSLQIWLTKQLASRCLSPTSFTYCMASSGKNSQVLVGANADPDEAATSAAAAAKRALRLKSMMLAGVV